MPWGLLQNSRAFDALPAAYRRLKRTTWHWRVLETTSGNRTGLFAERQKRSKISRSKSRYLCSQHDANEQPGAQNRSFVRSGRFPHKFRPEVREDGLSGMPARMVAVVAGGAGD